MFSASRAAWSLITRHGVSTPFFLCDLGSKVFASTVAARNRDTEPMTLPPHLRHMNTAIGPSMRPKSRKSVSPAFLATQNPQSIDWKRDSGPRLQGRVGQPRPALLPTPPLSRSLSSSSIFSSRRSVTKRRKRPFSTEPSNRLHAPSANGDTSSHLHPKPWQYRPAAYPLRSSPAPDRARSRLPLVNGAFSFFSTSTPPYQRHRVIITIDPVKLLSFPMIDITMHRTNEQKKRE